MKKDSSLHKLTDLHLKNKENDILIEHFRIKSMTMTYTPLGIEYTKSQTQALFSGRRLLNSIDSLFSEEEEKR